MQFLFLLPVFLKWLKNVPCLTERKTRYAKYQSILSNVLGTLKLLQVTYQGKQSDICQKNTGQRLHSSFLKCHMQEIILDSTKTKSGRTVKERKQKLRVIIDVITLTQ